MFAAQPLTLERVIGTTAAYPVPSVSSVYLVSEPKPAAAQRQPGEVAAAESSLVAVHAPITTSAVCAWRPMASPSASTPQHRANILANLAAVAKKAEETSGAAAAADPQPRTTTTTTTTTIQQQQQQVAYPIGSSIALYTPETDQQVRFFHTHEGHRVTSLAFSPVRYPSFS
jgi:hypothetical protein